MKYPDEKRMLIVRPCLKTICLGVRSASKLLSVVLYRARNCADDEKTFTFTCTQADLVHDLCEELTTKQLHDMAIPLLQLLGYLDVNGSGFRHVYTVHLDKVQLALSCYKDMKKLEEVLISFIREKLEEVPMDLELVLNDLEEVLIKLEEVLKTIGRSSNSKRGRKPRQEAALEAIPENPDNKRDIRDSIDSKRESGAFAPVDFLPTEEDELSEENEDTSPTEYRLPAIKLNGHKEPEAIASIPDSAVVSPPTVQSPQSQPDGATTRAKAGESRPSDEKKETPAQKKARLKRREAEIAALFCELMGRQVVMTRDNKTGAKDLAEAGSTDAEITQTYHKVRKDKFWGPKITLSVIAKFLDATVTDGQTVSAPPQPTTRPTLDEIDISIFEVDRQFRVYQRRGDEQEWILWQGEFCTPQEADERGYAGGFGLYNVTQYEEHVLPYAQRRD